MTHLLRSEIGAFQKLMHLGEYIVMIQKKNTLNAKNRSNFDPRARFPIFAIAEGSNARIVVRYKPKPTKFQFLA